MSDKEQDIEGTNQAERDKQLTDTDNVVISNGDGSYCDESTAKQESDVRFNMGDHASTIDNSKHDQENYQTSSLENQDKTVSNDYETKYLAETTFASVELDQLECSLDERFVDSETWSRRQSHDDLQPRCEDISSLPSSTKLRILQELEQMQADDDAKIISEKHHKNVEKERILNEFYEKRKHASVNILPNVQQSRNSIGTFLKREIRSASNVERERLNEETDVINLEIEAKYGPLKNKETDFTALASDFYESKKQAIEMLPEHIRRSLTSEEINDLRLVFEMFDPKEKGYITVTDLRRASGMLGFKAKKKVFMEMIAELTKDSRGCVTLVNFLDFIVRIQGEGPDPYDEILQGFCMLDVSEKGYLTFDDIREASDRLGVALSNRAIREMMQEADTTGNGKICQEDFIRLMIQTNTFKMSLPR